MSRKIEFCYDLLSPYGYLAFCRLPGLAKRMKAELVLQPISLPRLHEMTGNTPPAMVPSRFAYIQKDVPELGRYYGIPISWPDTFPCRSGRAMSVLTLVEGEQRLQLTRKLYEAYWIEGSDIGDPDVLASLVGEQLLEQAADPEIREKLLAATRQAADRGAFGVPTCFVGEQMFFGNDRLFMLQVCLNQ